MADKDFIIREAAVSDIPQMQIVRNAVKENVLSDPSRVTDEDCSIYITERGKGWVCIHNDRVVGFSIVDLIDNNVWALFIDPEFEGKGIGRLLHDQMLNWYFHQTDQTVWLSTTPGTRAEKFYRTAGWRFAGPHGSDEIRFEMTLYEFNSRVV